MIYIVGHKSPDLDSVIGAIAVAYINNKTTNSQDFMACVNGEMNLETKYILEQNKLASPQLLTDVEGKEVILVDHNAKEESPANIEKAKIIDVIDHHKINFASAEPMNFTARAIGSTCSILYAIVRRQNIEIPDNILKAMFAAILVDTVILRSPTTTPEDKNIVEEISAKLKLNYQEYGMEIFKVRSDMSSKSPAEIIHNDFKDFNFGGHKIGLGQIETVDLLEFDNLIAELKVELSQEKSAGGYHTVILFITDILKEGSKFLVFSDQPDIFEHAFNVKLENSECYIAGVMSRKKQVVPPLEKAMIM